MLDWHSTNTNSMDFYLVYFLLLFLIYMVVILAIYLIKRSIEGNTAINTINTANTNSPPNSHSAYDIDLLSPEQKSLRFRFLLVSTAIKAAIWVKAPYIFALYNRLHGFTRGDIGILYAIDNLSALVMGPIMGSLGDIYGRKKFCLLYVALVVTQISLRLTGSHLLAYFAQFLTGLAGALVDTAFESWLIFEASAVFPDSKDKHIKHLFLREIFSKQVSIDCYTSILLTAVASFLYLKLGLPFPFYACICFVSLAGLFILIFWRENDTEALREYKSDAIRIKAEVGSTDSIPDEGNNIQMTFWDKLHHSWECIKSDSALLSVGVIESCFRITLQLFVFIWTPILEETVGGLIHPGSVFVCFMIARLVGSDLFEMTLHTNSYLVTLFITSTAGLAFVVIYSFEVFNVRMLMFVYFDGLAGIFNPLFSSLKSQMIPEKLRNTVMNFFRIPINMFSIFALVGTNYLSTLQICLIAAAVMLLATLVNLYLYCFHEPPDKKSKEELHEEKARIKHYFNYSPCK